MSQQPKWEQVKEGDKVILKNEFTVDEDGQRHNVVGTFSRLLRGGDVLVELSGGIKKQMRLSEIIPLAWKEIHE